MVIARSVSARLPGEVRAVLGGLAAYGVAEIATRLVRIVAIVTIAHRISPETMGAAALALSLFELVRVLANAGIGQRIIAADALDLDATCRTARTLFWGWCGAIALLQLIVAGVMAMLFDNRDVAAMLAVLSAVYLLMPGGLVQVFLLMRAGRLGVTARIAATQTLADHILSMLLVLVWPSAWALVLPKLLTAPIWLVLVRRAMPWRPAPGSDRVPLRHFTRFGVGVIVTDLVGAARQQLDKLIVGAMLGTKALGIYYFAFNAGVGITNSFVASLSIVLFPHLCAAKTRALRLRRLGQSLGLALALFLPVTLTQVLLAPVYVPLLFGAHWASAAPLVAILGLGAVPMIFASVATAWLRAENAPGIDAVMGIGASAAALVALTLGCRIGLATAATAYVAALYVVLVPATLVIFARAGWALPRQTSPQEQFA